MNTTTKPSPIVFGPPKWFPSPACGRGAGRGWGFLFSALFLFASPLPLLAKSPGATFLNANSSIRAEALGGISTGAEGAEAIGSNPALLSSLGTKSELYASFSQPWEDTTDGHLSFASALNRRQTWGLSATFISAGETTSRDEWGQPTGGHTATHHEIGAGAFSWELKPGWHGGLTGNLYQSTLAGESSGVSWAMDAGLSGQIKQVLISASVNHLGPGIKYIDQRDPLPSVLQLDGSWTPGPLSVMAGYHRSLAGSGSLGAVGVEYRWRALALRAGLHAQWGGPDDLALASQTTANQLLDNLTTGFGLRLGKSLRMDYAFQQSAPEWGPAHALALTWSWGEIPPPTQALSKKEIKNRPLPKKSSPSRMKLGK